MTPTATEKRERIIEFLDSGVWPIAEDRSKTGEAVIDLLLRLPGPLMALIIENLRILVVAPPRHRISNIVPYMLAAGNPPLKFSVIILDARIETYDPAIVWSIVADAFSHAFASISGHERPDSPIQDEPAFQDGGTPGRPN